MNELTKRRPCQQPTLLEIAKCKHTSRVNLEISQEFYIVMWINLPATNQVNGMDRT